MALPEGNLVKSSFRRGMLFDVSDHHAPEDAVKFIDNMLPSPLGALTTRTGRTRKSTAVVGDIVYDVFRWLKSAGVANYENIIAYKDGANMKYADNDGTTTTDHVTGLVDGNPVIGMQKKYRLFLCNSQDNVKVLVDDSGIQNRDAGLGEGPDLSAITPTDAGAGSIEAGDYKYRITAVYGDDGESNPGNESAAAVTIGANRDINVSGAGTWSHPAEPAGLTRTAYNIYRNQSPDTEYHFVAQIAASSTSYVDSTTQATVDGNAILHDNHNAPPTDSTGMVWWDYENIAIAWGENTTQPNRLYFSELGKPEIFKTVVATQDATNTAEFQDVPQESEDNPIVTVVTNGPLAYVFNRFGVRVLTPTSASRAYKVDMVANSSDHGIIGPKAVTVTDSGEIYYVSTDGLRLVRGRVDVEINPNTDSGTTGLVTKSGSNETGVSVNSIIHGVPASLRKFVYAHEFRDQIHISLGTDAVSDTTPTLNNDVLIFDIPSGGFVYSSGRQVYGFVTVNDSGNDYQLWAGGYTSPVSDPTDQNGNYWREYDPGKTTDDDAQGVSKDINWVVKDFNRAVPNFNVAKLREFLIDAGVSNGTMTVQLMLDIDRLSTTKQFTFTSTSRTAWQAASYWQGDPATTLQATASTADYNSGQALTDLVALFTAISDGEFRIVINAANRDVTSLDFSSDTTIENVVATINAGLDGVPATARCDYVKSPGYFRFTHDSVGASNSVTDVLAVPAGVGTDIATAALLGTGSSEIVSQAKDPASPFTGLDWVASGVEDATNTWSTGKEIRGAPRRAEFYGERAQMVGVSISCTTTMTIYGYRLRYHVLEPVGAGVT